jgi:K+-sensing histidine kinase KdpD
VPCAIIKPRGSLYVQQENKELFVPSRNNGYERLSKEYVALTEISKTLTSPLDLSELLDAVMKEIVSVVDQADIGAIMLWDQPTGVFRPAAAFGYDLNLLKQIDLREGESITGKAYNLGETCLLRTMEEVARAMADMRPSNRQVMAHSIGTDLLPNSAVATPITTGDRRYGVLVLESLDHHKQFTEDQLPFVRTLGDLIALAIDRARLEAANDAAREARQTERMRSEVLAALSHELRMPLSTIKGYATAMQLDEISWSEPKRAEFLRLIEEACDDMEGMITDILDSVLIAVDRISLEYQPIKVQQIACEVASEVEHRSAIHHPVLVIPSDFPVIEADTRWIKQVFRNILDNAVKYSPNGGLIVIKGEVHENDVVVSVADQGIGIASEDLIPLFEKYFRVRSVSTLHISGTGLGLPIARSIIEAHGGRIWVESKVGEGTTIFFSLPRRKTRKDKDAYNE